MQRLAATEEDSIGAVVYVDLEPRGVDSALAALRARLLTIQPTARMLERMPLINGSRVLVEIEDPMALGLFRSWFLTSALKGPMGEALSRLFQPLGGHALLLGAHYICPRVTEYEPRILPQAAHTDVDTRGEVFAIGAHLLGEHMNTLLDPLAALDSNGEVRGASGFRQAATSIFAFETAAVHAGPGTPHVPGPYPRFLTNRVFFLICAADLDPTKIVKHRADNGLRGRFSLTIDLQ